MANSFQDQFLKLGLVDKKQIKQAKSEKHKNNKAQKGSKSKKNNPQENSAQQENLRIAQEAAEKKKKRVQTLNREREEKLQKRAKIAQIKQIIEQKKIAQDETGQAYRFTVKGKIHRIFVSAECAEKLSKGVLGIVQAVEKDGFTIVPKETILKLQELDDSLFHHLTRTEVKTDSSENDPYAQYKVPDDLMW